MPIKRLLLGEIFKEDFQSNFHVAQNGGEITGNPGINNAYESDGSGDSIVCSSLPWANIGRKFSFFVRINRVDSYVTKSLFGTDVGNGPLFRFASSSLIQFWNDTGAATKNFSISTPASGAFTIGLTYDDSTQEASVYVDGVLSATQTMGQVGDLTGNFVFGGRLADGTDSFDGGVDEFSLNNRILTAEEFLDLHNKSTFTYKFSSYYAFQDKIGSANPFMTSDISGNGLHATLGDGVTAAKNPTKLQGINGFNFDGTADYIEAPHIADVKTVIVWANVKNAVSFRRLITKGENRFSMLLWNDGTYRVYFQDTTLDINSGITPGEGLHMFASTFDGSTLRTYVDDVAGATGTRTNYTGTDVITIGKYGPIAFQWYNSDIYTAATSLECFTPTQLRDVFSKGPRYLGIK